MQDAGVVVEACVNCAEAYHPFPEIGVAALRMVAESKGIEMIKEQAEQAILPVLTNRPPHPDIIEGLTALKKQGLLLVSLTNSTDAGCVVEVDQKGHLPSHGRSALPRYGISSRPRGPMTGKSVNWIAAYQGRGHRQCTPPHPRRLRNDPGRCREKMTSDFRRERGREFRPGQCADLISERCHSAGARGEERGSLKPKMRLPCQRIFATPCNV